ncbi:MAG: hypothetical protein ACI4EN_07090 [Butyrivibrio sp.]
MKKNRKKILVVIILFVIAVAAVFGILINRGFRFTSESALTSSSEEYRIIHTKEYNFYYTAIDFTDREGNYLEAIKNVVPVKKYAFLYKEDTSYTVNKVVIKNSRNPAGEFMSFKGRDCYYNFYIMPYFQIPLEFAALDSKAYTYQNTVVSGEVIPITSLSYFITDKEVTDFEIEGVILEVIPGN